LAAEVWMDESALGSEKSLEVKDKMRRRTVLHVCNPFATSTRLSMRGWCLQKKCVTKVFILSLV
jgi:hypothetical protein